MSRFEDCMQNVECWLDRVKILTWDGSGLVLYYKRIEGQFTWPPIKEGVMSLSHAQLSVLLDGSDWKRVPMRVVDQPMRAG
ncbi:IS66 family insertion sequence element accessory protein TnpB [Bradyrhizobium sp. JR3.5]